MGSLDGNPTVLSFKSWVRKQKVSEKNLYEGVHSQYIPTQISCARTGNSLGPFCACTNGGGKK